MNVCVLFNPKSGSAGQLDTIRDLLAAEHATTFIEIGPTDDLEQTAADSARNFDVVAAAGGDGTVAATVRGLVSAKATARLAVLPLGTGNDLARTLAVPLDPAAAAGLIATGRVRTIDVARVEGGPGGYMVNAATGGFSGRVASDVTPELKGFWGPLAYLRGAAGKVGELPRFRLTLTLDDAPPETLDVLNVAVANGRTAAGGFAVAPTANPEDGLLDVVLVRAGDVLDLTVIAARMMHGDYLGDENVIHRRARRAELVSDPPMPFSIDGELCEDRRFAFTVLPRAVRVIVGPDYRANPDPEPAIEDDEPAEGVVPPAVRKGVAARLFGLLAGLLIFVRRAPLAYTLGVGLIALLGLAFAGVAGGVRGGEVNAWNDAVVRSQHARATPELTSFALAVTWLGNRDGMLVLVCGLSTLFLVRKRYLDVVTLLAVVAGVLALEGTLKPLFANPRPDLFLSPAPVGGYSFPSGHALRAAGIFGLAAFLLLAERPFAWWRGVAAAGCELVAVGVCWSRVYLGVHWPTDVIAGWLAATAWVAACVVARHYARTRPRDAAGRAFPGRPVLDKQPGA